MPAGSSASWAAARHAARLPPRTRGWAIRKKEYVFEVAAVTTHQPAEKGGAHLTRKSLSAKRSGSLSAAPALQKVIV